MYKNKKILALITARGGSKGVPGKNIRLLAGKPLIAWTIEQAGKGKYIDRLIVSTDDVKIAEVSRKYGAAVPFLRPKKLATDKAKSIDVILHAIKWIEKNEKYYDILVLLQPTSPLRLPEDINRAVELLFRKKAGATVSACKVDRPWMNMLSRNGCIKDFMNPKFKNKNRQEMPDFYRINGALYVADIGYMKRHRGFLGKRTFAYVMPKERSVDIDDELDLLFAESLMRRYRRRYRDI